MTKTYEELVDEIADLLFDRMTGDDDDIEEKLEEYAIDAGIFDPGRMGESDGMEADRMIRFEGETMLAVWERLAMTLLIERDKATRRRWEIEGVWS